jgi:4-amino-4-deoxy-L-arabinose transferase-like glycosyltransferase
MLSNEQIKKLSTNKPILLFVVFTALGLALFLRLFFASMISHPGHGDYPFYYTVAENLVDGRGFTIDYIWHYLNHPDAITHVSYDYWMPLTSLLISIPMFAFGKSLFAALLLPIIMGLALSVLTYFISKAYSDSRLTAFLSAGLVLFMPELFIKSLQTDSAIFYAFLVSASLLCIMKGVTHPKFFLLAGLVAGLAHLTRQDGLLLIPVIFATILLSRQQSLRAKAFTFSCALGIYLLVLSPLIVSNLREFGAPFPPGPSKTMFITQYEDLYVYSKELSFQNYLKLGPSEIVLSKVRMAISHAWHLYERFGEFLSILMIVGLAGLAVSVEKRKQWMLYFPPLLFLVILLSFYTLVATFIGGGGGFLRSGMALTPFLVVIAVDLMNRMIASKAVVCASILIVLTLFVYHDISDTKQLINTTTRLSARLMHLKKIVAEDANHQGVKDVVIMTRDPWEVYHSTRYKAIQIPNEGLEVIVTVAQKYGANYLLLPAPREALTPLYEGKTNDDRLLFVASVPDSELKLFRFK